MKITYPNPLNKDEALTKLKAALADAIGKYSDKVTDIQETWDDNVGNFSFSSYGFTIKVKAIVEDYLVTVEGKIPWLLASYTEKIEKILLDNIAKALEL